MVSLMHRQLLEVEYLYTDCCDLQLAIPFLVSPSQVVYDLSQLQCTRVCRHWSQRIGHRVGMVMVSFFNHNCV